MIEKHDDATYKQALLDLLGRVDQVLAKAGIEYFAVYGTCLGAVRECGIIPWDDDIDIAVWRKDFKSTLRILEQSGEGIFAGDRDSVPGCPLRCGRIFNRVSSQSTLEERRAYIDLHVIDFAVASRLNFYWLVLWYVGISRIVQRRRRRNLGRYRLFYAFADLVALPFVFCRTKFLEKVADWLYICDQTTQFVKITFDGNRKRYLREDFTKSIRVRFNTGEIPVPVGYARYLSECYGDWRTLPSEDERKSHAFDPKGEKWTVLLPSDDDRCL